jgi:hypothetical protein
VSELKEDDIARLEFQRSEFDRFVSDALPATEDLVRSVLQSRDEYDADEHLADLELFLPIFAALIRDRDLTEEDLIWLHVRAMYMLGQYLCQRFSATWVLDDVPDSPVFACFVIDIPVDAVRSYRVDPSELAFDVLDAAAPRDLFAVLEPVIEHTLLLREQVLREPVDDVPVDGEPVDEHN